MHSLAPSMSSSFSVIAERFRRAGQMDRAVALCREGLAAFPNHLSARVTLGCALLEQGHVVEAHRELQAVLKRAPDNLAAIRGLAELHARGVEEQDAHDMREAQRSDYVEVAAESEIEYAPLMLEATIEPVAMMFEAEPLPAATACDTPIEPVSLIVEGEADGPPLLLQTEAEPAAMMWDVAEAEALPLVLEAQAEPAPMLLEAHAEPLPFMLQAAPEPVVVRRTEQSPPLALAWSVDRPARAARPTLVEQWIAPAIPVAETAPPVLAPATPVAPLLLMAPATPVVVPAAEVISFDEFDPPFEIEPELVILDAPSLECVDAQVAQMVKMAPRAPQLNVLEPVRFQIEDVIDHADEADDFRMESGSEIGWDFAPDLIPERDLPAPAPVAAAMAPVPQVAAVVAPAPPVQPISTGPITVLDDWLARIHARRSELLSEYAAS